MDPLAERQLGLSKKGRAARQREVLGAGGELSLAAGEVQVGAGVGAGRLPCSPELG